MARGGAAEQTVAPEEVAALQAKLAEVTAELESARNAAAAAQESGEGNGAANDRLGAALEQIAGFMAAQQAAQAASAPTFARGETKEDVYRSLEGTVTAGSLDANGDPVDHSGAKLDRPVTFKAEGKNFNIIRKSRNRWTDMSGDLQITPGVHYSFAPHGTFTTDDEEVVEFLKAKPEYKVLFWLEGDEPDRVPDAGPTIDRVIDAVFELDVATLDEIEHEERATYQREAVLVSVERARDKIASLQGGEA